MIPRSSYAATSITTASLELGDPAIVALANIGEDIADTETTEAALARIVKALGALMPAWHRDPARGCADIDPAVFVSRGATARAEAFQACGRCPADIRRDCLAYAIDTADTVAIMGGCDGPARRPLVRERQKQLEEQRRQLEAEAEEITDAEGNDRARKPRPTRRQRRDIAIRRDATRAARPARPNRGPVMTARRVALDLTANQGTGRGTPPTNRRPPATQTPPVLASTYGAPGG